MQPHLGKRFKRSAKTFATLTCCTGEPFKAAMVGGQEGDDPVGFAVIDMVEDDGG